ncbi:MAG: hypothetical protein H6Q56_1705 [Deltaproteobacteria bacterium]|nr:hypothetical protein [Deltaproteobacteria bacterium]
MLEEKDEMPVTNCELIEECFFINDRMTTMPSTAAAYKKTYCERDFATCGRYLVCKAIGRENIPQDLFPHQCDRAIEIICRHS